jgi:hypothetical protein
MQNTSPVFSVPAAATDLKPFRRVKLTAAGAAYAGPGDTAVGTLLPGDPGDDLQAAVQDLTFGVHFAVAGSGTDIAVGDEVEAAAAGKVVKLAGGVAVGVALEACGDEDDMIRVKYYPTSPATFKVVAAGIHEWGGGVATTDSIPVAGLLATDVVVATLVERNATQTLVLAASDADDEEIDLTLSANGADGLVKISYAVLRA